MEDSTFNSMLDQTQLFLNSGSQVVADITAAIEDACVLLLRNNDNLSAVQLARFTAIITQTLQSTPPPKGNHVINNYII